MLFNNLENILIHLLAKSKLRSLISLFCLFTMEPELRVVRFEIVWSLLTELWSMRCHIYPSFCVDIACLAITSLLFLSPPPSSPPSQTDWLTEGTDLIPGMMLSNYRAETDLHNQTIGGKMGHEPTGMFLNNMSTRTEFICFLSHFLIALSSGTGVAVTQLMFGDVSHVYMFS